MRTVISKLVVSFQMFLFFPHKNMMLLHYLSATNTHKHLKSGKRRQIQNATLSNLEVNVDKNKSHGKEMPHAYLSCNIS